MVSLNAVFGCCFRSQRKRSHLVLPGGFPAACEFSAKDFYVESSLGKSSRSCSICSLNLCQSVFNNIRSSALGRISVRLRPVGVWASLCTPFPAPICRKCRSSQKMLTTRRTWRAWFSRLWTKPPLWTSLSPSLPRQEKPPSFPVSALSPCHLLLLSFSRAIRSTGVGLHCFADRPHIQTQAEQLVAHPKPCRHGMEKSQELRLCVLCHCQPHGT